MENQIIAHLEAKIGNKSIKETLRKDEKIGARFYHLLVQTLKRSYIPDLQDQSPYWHLYLSILAVYIYLNSNVDHERIKEKAGTLFFKHFNNVVIELEDKAPLIGLGLTSQELRAINTNFWGYAESLAKQIKLPSTKTN